MTYQVHKLESGRYAIAGWSEYHQQWQSPDVDGDVSTVYGYAGRIERIPALRTYAHRSSARRRMRALLLID